MAAPNVAFERSGINWTICRTAEELQPLARELADQHFFAWDTETNGRSPYVGKRIIGHSAAWRRSSGEVAAFYAPCRHEQAGMSLFDDQRQIEPSVVTELMRPALEGRGTKTGHNLSFDLQFGWVDDIDVQGPLVDTMLASRIYNENLRRYSLANCIASTPIPHEHGWKTQSDHALQQIARFLKVQKKWLERNHGHKYVPIDVEGRYACQDAAYTLLLGEWLSNRNFWPETWALEMGLLWVCADIQRVGVPINPSVLEQLRDECRLELEHLTPQIWKLAGEEFKISSDAELRRILFDKLGYPAQHRTKKDIPSVDDDALWALETKHGCDLAALRRRYGSFNKLYTTYSTSIVDLIDPHNILHGNVNQAGAKTGRMAMSEPNLQNVPVRTALGRRVREAFITRPGKLRYCLDYSQVELRMLAHLSQDPTLLRIYHEGLDAHTTTALEAFGTAEVVNGVDMRRVAKILNFGVSFDMTEIGLMGNVNKDLPEGVPEITEEQAAEFIRYYANTYGGVVRWKDNLVRMTRAQNCEAANIFGRPRRVPDLNHKLDWIKRKARRSLIATLVQGGAADLIKRCMLASWRYAKSQTICDTDLVLMIHDDLQWDMEPSGSARVVREIKHIMESTCQDALTVPIQVDVEVFTTHWGAKQKVAM